MIVRMISRLLALCLLVAAVMAPAAEPRPLILISIDGLRADYLDRGLTPTLSRLAARGVRGSLHPSFPTKTFPNHFTLVTGLRPDRHGIVGNVMVDAARPGARFTLGDQRQSFDPFWWQGAEPIWISAERAGIRTATMFWPGSETEFGGRQAQDWARYDKRVTNVQRVETVLDWMRRPIESRPRFVTLYFDSVDNAGHDFGPDSPEAAAALVEIDARIAALVDGLGRMGRSADMMLVTDHGMAAVDPARTIQLASLLPAGSFAVTDTGPYAGIDPAPGMAGPVEAALLVPHPHMSCHRKAELPARLHFGAHPRVPAIICIAQTGWMISADPARPFRERGSHGWDSDAPEMLGGLLAWGPSFARGLRIETVENVDVYPLLARLLGIAPRPNDGSPALVERILAPENRR
jgi:predicted AlkP superfamily pyrophosphatase or phosphodiesterase